MAEEQGLNIDVGQALQSWADLTPDPEAMTRVTTFMMAGVALVHAEAAEPGEADFRLLTIVWATVALCGYLAWDLLAGWFALHPVWTAALIACGCASLVAPLLLVPILPYVESLTIDEGGSSL